MKKIWLKRIAAVTASVALISGVAIAAACSDDAATYTVTYNYNYEGAPAATTQQVREGGTATKPADPTRDGYTFDDWFTDAACTEGNEVDFTAAITSNVTYYAGWTQNMLDVTFVLYGTETEVVQVAPGGTVEMPEEPTRSGYLFEGWYADSNFEETFDFSAPITEDTTVYANWIEVDENSVIVTYMWNYDGAGIFRRESLDKGSMLVTLPGSSAAVRDGYLLNGWYLDEECTQAYSRTTLNENLTLYAGWDKGYVFEAEYTDLTDPETGEDRHFFGYSDDSYGPDAITPDTTGTASNGYFMGSLYMQGEYLYFEINATEAVTDATLTISLGLYDGFVSRGETLTLTPEDFAVTVNGTAINYSDINILFNATGTTQYGTFTEFTLGNISLDKGENVIRLEVTNDNRGTGGSQNATAPLVDCITIYSGTELTWEPVTSNIR